MLKLSVGAQSDLKPLVHPTQSGVGYARVLDKFQDDMKRSGLISISLEPLFFESVATVRCSESSAQTYFSKNPTPFVMGPSKDLWLIDNHHGKPPSSPHRCRTLDLPSGSGGLTSLPSGAALDRRGVCARSGSVP